MEDIPTCGPYFGPYILQLCSFMFLVFFIVFIITLLSPESYLTLSRAVWSPCMLALAIDHVMCYLFDDVLWCGRVVDQSCLEDTQYISSLAKLTLAFVLPGLFVLLNNDVPSEDENISFLFPCLLSWM